jgi:propanol-preferring alcohol dehydrogenase
MRSVALSDHQDGPALVERPVPEPGRDEVRIAMRACGICGSDVHIIDGETVPAFLPIVLGHEASGVVDAVGAGVDDYAVGDRVTVNPMVTCGNCRMCGAGRGNLCRNISILGLSRDGAHSEFFVVPADNLIALPDSIPFPLGAIVADAIATPYRAILESGVQPGATVAVFGLGGLGLHAAMILDQVYGAHVIGVDASDAALARAADFGLATVVDARAGRAADQINAATGGGVDASFEFVGSVAVVEQALRSLDYGGACTVAGVGADRLHLSLRQETLVAKGQRLIGTHGYISDDVRQLLSWLDAGRLRVDGTVSHTFALDDYAQGLKTLRDRSANAIRVVITNG